MASRHSTIAARLLRGQMVIENTRKTTLIADRMKKYGYDEAGLGAGEALWKGARLGVEFAKQSRSAKLTAGSKARSARSAAERAYRDAVALIDGVFADSPDSLRELGIARELPRGQDDFMLAARSLIAAAQRPAVLARLEAANLAADVLASEAVFAAYEEAALAQQRAMSASEQATVDQATALDALDAWVEQYQTFAKVGLRDQPKLLELVGVAERRRAKPASNEQAKEETEL